MRLALVVTLPPEFHVQSNAPRDPTLIPTVLTVEPPAGAEVIEVVYPAPLDFKMADIEQPLAVFPHEFALGAEIALPPAGDARAAPGAGQLALPGLQRPPVLRADDGRAFVDGERRAPRIRPSDTGASRLRVRGDRVRSRHPSGRSRAGDRHRRTAADGPFDLRALDDFTLAGTTGGYLRKAEFLSFVRDAERGVHQKGWFEGRGPLAILLIVLLGGIALNLTPCVLPMIPINLAIIGAGAAAASRARGFWLGAAYGGAMALVYGVLGVIVILTAGTFGTLNASPWFNLGIAVLFVALALAMFDVFEIDFSRFSSAVNPKAGRGTVVLAFTMGGVAALLAGACVAPVVIQVVLFSSNLYAAGTTIALALPFVLGLGMALPWPFAGAGLASLPKPGAWMVRVKQVFGVLILATAVYYGYVAYSIFVEPLGRSRRGPVERRGAAEGRLARVARRRARDRPPRRQARAHRLLGDLVQELPDDGQDDAGGCRGEGGARRLRAGQVPGRGSRCRARAERHDAVSRGRAAHLRHPAAARQPAGQRRLAIATSVL